MIIFVIAVLVLIASILVNFVQAFKKNRILIMSILAILMIMVNFINEIDIIMSPPQYILRTDSQQKRQSSKQIIKLNFKSQFPNQSLKYFQKQKHQIIRELQQDLKIQTAIQTNIQAQKQAKQNSLSLLEQLPLSQHIKPLIKQERNFLQQMRKRVVDSEDWIIAVQGFSKMRFQLLMGEFIRQLNQKKQTYNIKFEQILYMPLYQKQEEYYNNNHQTIYMLPQKLFNPNQNNYYFLIVYNKPSDSLLKFLYKTYTSKNLLLTIIFLDLDEDFKVFPISSYAEQIQFSNQINYQTSIKQFLIKQNPQKQNQILRQLEACQKYVQLNYQMFLRFITNVNRQSVATICYDRTFKQISPEVQCIRKMIKDQNQQISYVQASKCWKGKQLPDAVQIVRKDKVKLKKQYFWSKKLSPANFGLQKKILSQNCTNQL